MSRISYRHAAFTGTKRGCTLPQAKTLERVLLELRNDGFLWLHDGDCVGADLEAASLWKKLKGRVQLHPPTSNKYRAFFPQADIECERRPYLDRDKDMVECSELLVATPQTYDEQRRSGTWATIRYGRKRRLDIIIIYPDGGIERE